MNYQYSTKTIINGTKKQRASLLSETQHIQAHAHQHMHMTKQNASDDHTKFTYLCVGKNRLFDLCASFVRLGMCIVLIYDE